MKIYMALSVIHIQVSICHTRYEIQSLCMCTDTVNAYLYGLFFNIALHMLQSFHESEHSDCHFGLQHGGGRCYRLHSCTFQKTTMYSIQPMHWSHTILKWKTKQNLANSVGKNSMVASQYDIFVKHVCLCHQPFNLTGSNKTSRYCKK